MTATVQKWGNSLALRLPKAVAQEMRVGEGDAVELSVEGRLLKVQTSEPVYQLEELLRGVKPANLHSETDWGSPRGGETW